jgi:hypothetical protein
LRGDEEPLLHIVEVLVRHAVSLSCYAGVKALADLSSETGPGVAGSDFVVSFSTANEGFGFVDEARRGIEHCSLQNAVQRGLGDALVGEVEQLLVECGNDELNDRWGKGVGEPVVSLI